MLRKKYPDLKILMQTIFEDNEKIFQSILAGASGYILKNTSPSRFLEYIKETFEGGAPMSPSVATKVLKMFAEKSSPAKPNNFNLSDREKEILSCLVKGMSYKLIADACFISIDTVRGHIRNIYEKLHVHNLGEAVAKAIRYRIVYWFIGLLVYWVTEVIAYFVIVSRSKTIATLISDMRFPISDKP